MTSRSGSIIEIGELSGMHKTEIDHVKAFITRRIDRFRRLTENAWLPPRVNASSALPLTPTTT
jgi:hypothetical protein